MMTVVPMRTTMMSDTSRTRTTRAMRSSPRPESRAVVGTGATGTRTKAGGIFDVVVWRRVIVGAGAWWSGFLETGVVAHGTGTEASWGVV